MLLFMLTICKYILSIECIFFSNGIIELWVVFGFYVIYGYWLNLDAHSWL